MEGGEGSLEVDSAGCSWWCHTLLTGTFCLSLHVYIFTSFWHFFSFKIFSHIFCTDFSLDQAFLFQVKHLSKIASTFFMVSFTVEQFLWFASKETAFKMCKLVLVPKFIFPQRANVHLSASKNSQSTNGANHSRSHVCLHWYDSAAESFCCLLDDQLHSSKLIHTFALRDQSFAHWEKENTKN